MNRSCTGLVRCPITVATLVALWLGVGCGGGGSSNGGGSTTPPPQPADISVTVPTPPATLQAGASQTVMATVANDAAAKGVSWTVSGAGCSGATCGVVSPATSAWSVGHVYRASGAAESADGNPDGDIGGRWNQVRVDNDHDHGNPSRSSSGEPDAPARRHRDVTSAELYGNSSER